MTKNTHLTFGQSVDTSQKDPVIQADACTSIISAMNSHNSETDCGLFAIAAGVSKEGGDPKKVAAMAVQQVATEYTNIYTSILSEENMPQITERLVTMLQKANKAIHNHVTNAKSSGEIVSLSAVMILKDTAYVAHVGNTRVYLVEGKTIKQLTKDHTRDEGKPQPTVYNSLGQATDPTVDTSTHTLPMDSKLLLCSGAMWRYVSDDSMLKFLTEEPYPQQACEKLVAHTKANGGTDNLAAVVVFMPEA
jgi:serine/threonine protein phosphatase PrpC